MIAIGRKNQLATIQHATRASDGQGGQTATWGTLGTAYVEVRPLSGREAQQAAQIEGVLATVVTMHFRDDVSVKDRLVIGARTLEILSAQDPDARRRDLQCLCAEIQQ